MTARKLILKHTLSPGDVVVMTAAIRDLHAAHPNSFLTDVRTPCPAIFEHSPFITRIEDNDPDATLLELHYPAIHTSNQKPHHFLEGMRLYLEEQLHIRIPQGEFKGDIYISENEKKWMSQVEEARGMGTPFWIVVAGGKWDFTCKHWSPARWQSVVNHFKDRMLFVQVGEKGHHHPELENVLDLRGQTNLRQLIRLIYHAEGVICPVTSLMHLAAAVPTKDGNLRPCVVVAGGREPVQWEKYPGHRFLDTIGMLPCCRNGGCWKSRVVPLADNDDKNKSLCERPYETDGTTIPECLHMISPEMVIQAIESYGTIPRTTGIISPAAAMEAPSVTPVTKQAFKPDHGAVRGKTLYIWAGHTYKGGHKIGDCITSAYTARLFAESDRWGRIILSRHPSHPMNYVYEQFIRDYDVQVIDEDWPSPMLEEGYCDEAVYPLCDELRAQRAVHGTSFDAYRELYRRVSGGNRQKALCGEERGLGRRNIFEYWFFGQEEAPEECPRGADFRPAAFGGRWNPLAKERSCFVSPHAFSQSNDIFTLPFWAEVIRGLAQRRIQVTVNTQNTSWFGKNDYIRYFYQKDDNFRELARVISEQRLSVSGNTGIAWMAAMNGVPLIVGEPFFFWYADFRMREAGVPAQIFSEPNPGTLIDMIDARLAP